MHLKAIHSRPIILSNYCLRGLAPDLRQQTHTPKQRGRTSKLDENQIMPVATPDTVTITELTKQECQNQRLYTFSAQGRDVNMNYPSGTIWRTTPQERQHKSDVDLSMEQWHLDALRISAHATNMQ
jgi:hypothetical protein